MTRALDTFFEFYGKHFDTVEVAGQVIAKKKTGSQPAGRSGHCFSDLSKVAGLFEDLIRRARSHSHLP